MQLTAQTVNRLVDLLAARFAGGSLVIYSGRPTSELAQELVRIAYPSPAFRPAVNGVAESQALQPATIQRDGDAAWARAFTASGEAIADLTVSTRDANEDADVLLERVDLQRNGVVILTGKTLTLPRLS